MMDILGRAISEYFYGGKEYKLWVHDNHGPKVEMIVPIYFRSPEAMPELELMAIDMCRGKTLDIGAGAGSHALFLQEKGIDVTAIDISEGAVGVMKDRGVEKAFVQDVFEMKQEKFDTLLLLMNGIGLVQTIEGLNRFLQHARTLLKKGGQLLFDSSDVAYLYEEGVPQLPHYYGEVKCCYEYRRQKSEWFSWLYIDEQTLREVALDNGFDTKVLFVDESDQYLAMLTLSK
jgi:SAM-dependent methyltransferase